MPAGSQGPGGAYMTWYRRSDFRVWQRTNQVGVDDGDGRRGQREAERERQRRHEGEERRASQAARREPDVAPQRVEPRPAPHVARPLAQLQRIAEAHRLAHQLAVRLHLALQRVLEAAAIEQVPEATEPFGHGGHHGVTPPARARRRPHAVSSTAPMAAVTRR